MQPWTRRRCGKGRAANLSLVVDRGPTVFAGLKALVVGLSTSLHISATAAIPKYAGKSVPGIAILAKMFAYDACQYMLDVACYDVAEDFMSTR